LTNIYLYISHLPEGDRHAALYAMAAGRVRCILHIYLYTYIFISICITTFTCIYLYKSYTRGRQSCCPTRQGCRSCSICIIYTHTHIYIYMYISISKCSNTYRYTYMYESCTQERQSCCPIRQGCRSGSMYIMYTIYIYIYYIYIYIYIYIYTYT